MERTLYVNLYLGGKVIHKATIRSDWKDKDYQKLDEDFPGAYIKTGSGTIPVRLLGQEYHHTDFQSLLRKKIL